MQIVKYFGEDAVVAKECDIAHIVTLIGLQTPIEASDQRLVDACCAHIGRSIA